MIDHETIVGSTPVVACAAWMALFIFFRMIPPPKVKRLLGADSTVLMSDSDSSDHEIEHLQYKVIILGDGAVGKTSVAQRFANNDFSTVYKQTIGLDFFLKKLTLPGKICWQVTRRNTQRYLYFDR